MKKALEQQAQDLQDRKRQFQEDQQMFEREYHEWLEKESQKQANSLNRAGYAAEMCWGGEVGGMM